MNAGKKDLVFEIIALIHNVCSNPEGQNGEIIEKSFTKKVVYGMDKHTAQISNVDKHMKKNYSYNPYNKEYINVSLNNEKTKLNDMILTPPEKSLSCFVFSYKIII